MNILQNIRKVCGIYAILHRDSGRRYIGSSVSINLRLAQHLHEARKGSLHYLYRVIREFGEAAFDLEVLEVCDRELLLERETFWIDFHKSASINGFNTNSKPINRREHFQHSEVTKERLRELMKTRENRPCAPETRAKISETHKGKKLTDEHRAAIGRAGKGKQRSLGFKHSEESKAKMSAERKGRVFSAEHRANLSKAGKGHKMPASVLEKLRAANVGRKFSEEHIRKLKEASTGRVASEATREKLRNAFKGRQFSLETRTRMSAARRARKPKAKTETQIP